MAAKMALEENTEVPEKSEILDDASLATVASLVRLHLPCRDLVRLQLVSKEWRTWCSENAASLWKARKQDMTRDWYFPIGPRTHSRIYPTAGTWYGLHHPSEKEHVLPDLEYFLRDWKMTFLTSASGLLLLHRQPDSTGDVSVLIVCNPLTKKSRYLPRLDPKIIRMEKICRSNTWNGVAVHLVVDDVSNTYEVVIIKRPFICTFNSQWPNDWSTSISPELSKESANLTIGSMLSSNGRIYMLEVVGDQGQHVAARVYVVESRRWLPDVYRLYIDKEMYPCVFGQERPHGETLVACLGDIYAIVPVDIEGGRGGSRARRRGRILKHKIGGVRFVVFKLQEEGKKFAFCVTLPFEVKFRVKIFWWWSAAECPSCWYKCVSKGAVIWLACEDQLLQFDVVTGRCNVQTVHLKYFECKFYEICGDKFIPYEPSFHVNP